MRELDAATEKQEVKFYREMVSGEMEKLILYPVTEDELDTLEKYVESKPLYQNGSTLIQGVVISAIFTLVSFIPMFEQIPSILWTSLCLVIALGVLCQALLLIIWRKSNNNFKKIFLKIRNRYKGNSKDP